MKKKLTLVILSICFIMGIIFGSKLYNYLKIKNARIEVILTNNLQLEFLDKKRVSSFIKYINGTIVDDYVINTTKIGKQNIEFEYINNDGIKVKYNYEVEIVDKVKPVIWLGGSYSLKKGSNIDITEKILCGDNYDSNPLCYIEGEYDSNKVGYYDLKFKAIDSSGNITIQPFTLHVYEPVSSNENITKKRTYTEFSDILKKYKKNNTKIGIDISKWQGDIDFKKIKDAGVEFIIIRVGYSKGTNGEYILDSKFIQNIEGANSNNIPVGLYFYSYANSLEHARKDARWVIEQIKDYNVELPIAFDWEEWSSFNEYNLSFFELSSISKAFLDEIENNGYTGMLYSSKTYLEKIWFPTDYDIWLAHYTKQTDYEGQYKFWQMCDNGRIEGINTTVDINIMYE